jgi:hypothetical protein
MNKSIIIHTHTYGSGGIGDFLRASLSLYSICHRYNLDYYINFNENEKLKQCFDIKEIPLIDNNIEYISLIASTSTENNFKPYINKFISEPKIYNIKCNLIGIESTENINKIREYYFTNILKPTQKVIDYINQIYEKYNITNNNYISVHIRCGDRTIDINNTNNSTDYRIDITNINIIKEYKEIINKFSLQYNINNLPIIIHSDCKYFKDELKKLENNFIYLDVDIKHIAENIGINTIDGYISTIAEFYIISKANKIFIPFVYSGFSHLASIINNKQLFMINSSEYYDLLHCNNIIKLYVN